MADVVAESLPSAAPPTLLKRLSRRPTFLIAFTVFMLIALMAIFAPVIAPQDPYAASLVNRLVPPMWEDGGSAAHPFGTDGLGRDYLSRMIYGARTSLVIGISSVLLAGFIGCSLGILGGYFGGRVDMVVNFIITCRLAMPGALLVLALVSLIGPSLPNLILVIGLLYWPAFAIVARTATMEVAKMDYVTAARAAGARTGQIVRQEILPNITAPILVIATLELAYIILAEAALSFLGLGVQPPLAAWGLMIKEGKTFMFTQPSIILIPGIALLILVLSINLIGDGLRDASDPSGDAR